MDFTSVLETALVDLKELTKVRSSLKMATWRKEQIHLVQSSKALEIVKPKPYLAFCIGSENVPSFSVKRSNDIRVALLGCKENNKSNLIIHSYLSYTT